MDSILGITVALVCITLEDRGITKSSGAGVGTTSTPNCSGALSETEFLRMHGSFIVASAVSRVASYGR